MILTLNLTRITNQTSKGGQKNFQGGAKSIGIDRSPLRLEIIWTTLLIETNQVTLMLKIILIQALYFCVNFRKRLLDYYANNKNHSDGSLFSGIYVMVFYMYYDL